MNKVKLAIVAIAGCASVAAHATMPSTLARFGSWEIGTVWQEAYSEDTAGGVGSDYVMTLAQITCPLDDQHCDILSVSWSGGDTIEVSANFQSCGESVEWDPIYFVEVERWRAAGPKIADQIEADFKAWIGQAALICDTSDRGRSLNLKQLRPAVREFSRRLNERN